MESEVELERLNNKLKNEAEIAKKEALIQKFEVLKSRSTDKVNIKKIEANIARLKGDIEFLRIQY